MRYGDCSRSQTVVRLYRSVLLDISYDLLILNSNRKRFSIHFLAHFRLYRGEQNICQLLIMSATLEVIIFIKVHQSKWLLIQTPDKDLLLTAVAFCKDIENGRHCWLLLFMVQECEDIFLEKFQYCTTLKVKFAFISLKDCPRIHVTNKNVCTEHFSYQG